MIERKFLPDIPLLPEEREALEKSGKPKLPGAPNDSYESKLLEVEEGLPLLKQVGDDLKTYKAITQNEKRKEFRRNKFKTLLEKPEELESYFDTLNILSESWNERGAEIEEYIKDLIDNLEKLIHVGTLSPESFKGWLTLLVKSKIYQPVAERVLKALIEKQKTPQEVVSFKYNLAQALFLIDDKEVFRKACEILAGHTPFVEGGENTRFVNFMKALWTTDNDALLTKAMEIDLVMYHFKNVVPEAFLVYNNKTIVNSKGKDLPAHILGEVAKNQDKVKRLTEIYAKSDGSTLYKISQEEAKSWPINVIFPGGKLRELYNQRKEQESEGEFVNLHLPGEGASLVSKDDVILRILSSLSGDPKGSKELRDPKYNKILFYLTPELSKDSERVLSEDVLRVRKEIDIEKTHGISPRGDQMLVTDPSVITLGIKSITFKVEEHAPSTTVFVEAGNYQFVLTLTPNLELKDANGLNIPISFEKRAFTEHLILSHLKELMCTERVKPGEKDNGNGKQIEREIEFRSRRPHLRKLPPGQGFSGDALLEGLADPARYDLFRINAELGLTKADGQRTYVRVSQKPVPGEMPLVSRAPHATDRLNEILKETNKKEDAN